MLWPVITAWPRCRTALSSTHSLVRDQVAQRVLGVNECEALSLIYHDHVHPGIYGESWYRFSKRQHCRNACASSCAYKATGASQPEFQPGAAFVELAPTRVSAAPMQRNIYSTCVQQFGARRILDKTWRTLQGCCNAPQLGFEAAVDPMGNVGLCWQQLCDAAASLQLLTIWQDYTAADQPTSQQLLQPIAR